ncbi:MAG: hypothetical protein RL204_424 [Bacteroidota bacterium]|jgi:hypothetical protein
MSELVCFKCGKCLTNETITREHIPAKAFYTGLPEEYKVNLLTIPACLECNQAHAKIDETMRDAIGIMNDKNQDHEEITRKAVKSILRKSKFTNLFFDENGKVVAVNFELNNFLDSALKTHLGIFFAKYGVPIPENFDTRIVFEGKPFQDLHVYESEVVQKYGWEVIGHADVFRYQIQDINAAEDGSVFSKGDFRNSIMVLSVMVFYNQFKFYGVTVDTDFKRNLESAAGMNR